MAKIVLYRNKCMLCNKEKTPLFSFPKNPERFTLWFKSIQKEDLLRSLPYKYLFYNAKLCNLHFKEENFTSTLKKVLTKFAVPIPLKDDSNQVSLTKSSDCKSSSSLCLPESNCNSLQETNLSNSQTVRKESLITVASSSNTVNKLKSPDVCRVVMTNLSSPEVVEDPFVTVITLCCTDRKEGIAFHRFLQNRDQRKLWILTVRRKNFKPSLISVLCPKHFCAGQIDQHSVSKSKFKENEVPNISSSEPLSHQKDEGLRQWEEIIPMNDQDVTSVERLSELHCKPSEIKKFYVKVIWNKSLSKTTEKIHSLPASTIPTTTPNFLTNHQTNKKQLRHKILAMKKSKKNSVCSNSDSKSGKVKNSQTDLADSGMERMEIGLTDVRTEENDLIDSPIETVSNNIESNNAINSIKGDTDVRMEENDLIESPVKTVSSNIESNNSINGIKESIDSNISHCDTSGGGKISCVISPKITKLESAVDPLPFQKVSKIEEEKNYLAYIAVPNEWWGITHTPQYIVCSKWNEFYDPIFRVIIKTDCSLKVFIKGRECVNENRKVSLENISSVLQEIDSYQICAGIDDKSMTYCMGYLENRSHQQFSIWCKGCQRRGEELMMNYRSLK